MSEATVPNSRAAILERRAAGVLTWSGPALMLLARSTFAVAAQGLVAAVYAAQGSATPWRDAAAWLPVYGTTIDLGCLYLLWWLARREGISLLDLIGFDRRRMGRDLLLGLALILPSLFFIFCGIMVSSLLVYGNLSAPQIFEPLPLLPTLYAVLVFPLVWGITEQTTYNGYILPRLQVLSGRTGFAVAVVAFVWSFQHVVMPLTFDSDFMVYRLLSPIPHSLVVALVYLRIRRILPLATAHIGFWMEGRRSSAVSGRCCGRESKRGLDLRNGEGRLEQSELTLARRVAPRQTQLRTTSSPQRSKVGFAPCLDGSPLARMI